MTARTNTARTVATGTVSRVLSLIPERSVRFQSGVNFDPQAAHCIYPERLTHVLKFLGWLSPLAVLTRDDQVVLGLVAANGRPVQSTEDDEGEELELESEPLELESEPWGEPAAAAAPVQEAVL